MQEARVKIMRLVAWSMRALCALNGCFSCALHGCPVLYHLNCMVMHAESKVLESGQRMMLGVSHSMVTALLTG